MDNRIKELIAVGASVTANCQPCLSYHVGKAKENGAGEQEIGEAITIAKMVRKGAMTKMDQFGSTVFKPAEANAGALEKGCGCG
ncbi:MAG: carboxymuconolactone decarboxylase family protein [Deltaproteobacteria bacterium]|nr:carboxymuconolactone decarboxylase family protein [Deltaproteobacteria bacterium]